MMFGGRPDSAVSVPEGGPEQAQHSESSSNRRRTTNSVAQQGSASKVPRSCIRTGTGSRC